jgi:hypothetical protein
LFFSDCFLSRSTIEMPEFIFVELLSFKMHKMTDHGPATLHLPPPGAGRIMRLYHEIREGLDQAAALNVPVDMVAKGKSSGRWAFCTSNTTWESGMHAEQQMLTNHAMFCDPRMSKPNVQAILLRFPPCDRCVQYFNPNGNGVIKPPGRPPMNAGFTPFEPQMYTPVFYLTQNLNPVQGGELWEQLEIM